METHDEDGGYEPPEISDIAAADDREFAVVPGETFGTVDFRN